MTKTCNHAETIAAGGGFCPCGTLVKNAESPAKTKAKPLGGWIPLLKKMKVECCDCGLRHLIEVRVHKNEPQWRATPITSKETK